MISYPEQEKEKYYVYEIWYIYEGMPYVTDNGYVDVREFDSKDEALKYIGSIVDDNVNIIRCISKVHPREFNKPGKFKN